MKAAITKQTTEANARKARGRAVEPTPALPEFNTGEEFDALSDADKERVWESMNREIPDAETTPLSREEMRAFRAAQRAAQRGRGRPTVGKGSTTTSLSIERGLFERATAFRKAHGMLKSELFALALGEYLDRHEAAAGRKPATPAAR